MIHKQMNKIIINTNKAPKAIGPYSQGVSVGQFIFTAGQIAIDPASGNIIEGGIEAETKQALLNIKNILESAGSDMNMIVKTTVFLNDINDFNRMNEVYKTFFEHEPPARSTIQVAALPKGAAIEIEAIALIAA
jgi:2-iminobutanoate/2-iminopropanoate deaminase